MITKKKPGHFHGRDYKNREGEGVVYCKITFLMTTLCFVMMRK